MKRTVAGLLLIAVSCASQRGLTAEQILGRWTVSGVECSDCGQRTADETGTVIDLGTTRIINPLYGNCETRPGFDLLENLDSRAFLTGPAEQWPAGVRGAASKVKSLLYGFITCDGVNYAQVAFASPSKAYYVFEANMILILTR